MKKHSKDIPWKKLTGMRDKLIHGYFTVDLKEVWNTAKNDISILKSGIEKIKTKV
ncbi:MAG: HepT-like ribonuclease domain-containing protein [Promethearchaeota archaeon]